MSTSPSRAAAAPSGSREVMPEIQPFPYDSIVPGSSTRQAGIESFAERVVPSAIPDKTDVDRAAGEAQARSFGKQEGLAEARSIFEEQLAKERSSLVVALAQFSSDRANYFRSVEAEVVQLALAIARKILHREAQLDPLLLAGMVRVALEKIDGATNVVLRVHPLHAAEWRKYLGLHLKPGMLPDFVEDPAQPPESCVLQTSMGTAVLGVEVQLKEIENGLMDLLAARPGASS